jgi:hypothetical protein
MAETKKSIKNVTKEERQAWIRKSQKTKKARAKQLQEDMIKIQKTNIEELKKIIDKLNYLTIGMTLNQLTDKQKDEVATMLLKVKSI